MKFTVGMSHFDDYDGAYFTIQALLLYHRKWIHEIIVVDNNPNSPHGAMLRGFIEGWQTSRPVRVQYVPMHSPVGTTQGRNMVFKLSTGTHTLCVDCHILIAPGGFEALEKFFTEYPEYDGLVCGPLLMDDLMTRSTHFEPVWRKEMLGIWSLAWEANGRRFAAHEENKKAVLYDITTGKRITELWDAPIPDIPWAGHERILSSVLHARGLGMPGDVFEIPAQGLGLFGCRTKDWLGFNPHFRGFGGEECYIHEKYRQAGRQIMCIGDLLWPHRFGRVAPPAYPLWRHHKVRNYVLGHMELGKDLAPVKEHFVEGRLYTQAEWNRLLADPVGNELPMGYAEAQKAGPRAPSNLPQPPEGLVALDDIFTWTMNERRDLHSHLPAMRALVDVVGGDGSGPVHVTEFTKRRESSVAFLAGLVHGPGGTLVSYQRENDALNHTLQLIMGGHTNVGWEYITAPAEVDPVKLPVIEETDILFIDSNHTADQLRAELELHGGAVRRFICLHDTNIYCEKGEHGGPGLCEALKEFLRDNPEWYVYSHTPRLYGLSVLGRDPADRPATKVSIWPPGEGPGTEFHNMVAELGFNERPGCTCKQLRAEMDVLGPDGCEREIDDLVIRISENAKGWGWEGIGSVLAAPKHKDHLTKRQKWAAAWKLLKTGKIWKINPADPFRGLVRLAIEAARQNETKP